MQRGKVILLLALVFSLVFLLFSYPVYGQFSNSLAQWEANMLQWGAYHCDEETIQTHSTWEGGVWYYDGIRVYHQIADYTGNSSWETCAGYVTDVYRTYVLNANGAIPGWRIFPHGLYINYIKYNDLLSRDAIVALINNAAYSSPQPELWDEALSRETAYNMNSFIVGERIGESRRQKLDLYVNMSLSHIDQWFVQQSAPDFSPFMFAVTCEALTSYYDEVYEDPRIIPSLEMGLNWIWDNAWFPEYKAFYYRANDHQLPDSASLNLLIASCYAWAYQKTGNTIYRDRGDLVFEGGVEGAWLGGGKQFSQNYRLSFDYVTWRMYSCQTDFDCNDDNPCTDDTCNAQGMCEFTPNDANICSDGITCTTGDHCINGACVSIPNDDLCSPIRPFCNNAVCNPETGCEESDCDPLVLNLQFDDNPADGVLDGSVYGHTCTCTNCPSLTSDRDDNANSAYLFDGTDDYIECASNDDLSITDDLTIAAWVYGNDDFSGETLVSKHYNSEYDTTFWNGNMHYYNGPNNLNGNDLTFGYYFNNGQWYHIALTRDGDTKTVKLYVNGIYTNQDLVYNDNPPSSSDKVVIGGRQYYQSPFNGIIDDVKVYNTVLSAEEVLGLYQGYICEATGSGECYYAAPGASGDCSFDNPCSALTGVNQLYTPGDVLYLLDGNYQTSDTPQYMYNKQGIDGYPITIKAYPGETPVFVSGVLGQIFHIQTSSYLILDGITLRPAENGGAMGPIILLRNNNDHITIRNCEIDGSLRYNIEHGLEIESSTDVVIENNHIHNIHYPTGNTGGDGSDYMQPRGDCISIQYSEFVLIANNTVERCNHGSISLEPGTYVKVMDNFVNAQYGSGIATADDSEYNLIQGNVITHAGGSTTYTKNALYLASDNNVARYNVIYSPSGNGIVAVGKLVTGNVFKVNNNLVYNNVAFGTYGDGVDDYKAGLGILVDNSGSADASVEGNTFANNILYNSTGTYSDSNNPKPESEIVMNLYKSNTVHNWLEPDNSATMPDSTQWGGNKFYNNLLRRYGVDGMTDPDIVFFKRDTTVGGETDHRLLLQDLENDGSGAWSGNIGSDPLFVSEEPDTYGLNNGWWHLQEGSPAIDAGVVVDDTIGAYVDTIRPGWGWSFPAHQGNAPDIGAWESPYSAETGICGDDNCNLGETCNACPQDCMVGDVDGNCNVDLSDLITVAGNFGCTGDCGDSDIDDNNIVNILDLILVGKNFT